MVPRRAVFAAWVIWLVCVAAFVFVIPPSAISSLILTGAGALCLTLVYQGQRRLPLWANITLLLLQLVVALIASMPWLLVRTCIYLSPDCGRP